MPTFRNLKMFFLVFTTLIGFALNGCLYENRETVFPEPEVPDECGTNQVTYSASVLPVLDQWCNDCHSQQNQAGNIILEGFDNLLVHVQSGKFLGAIQHDAGFSPMPKNEGKLPKCDIERIAAWIEDGAPNN